MTRTAKFGLDPGLVTADLPFNERYAERQVVSHSGTAELAVCRDRKIGRQIAMKTFEAGDNAPSGVRARFLREARIQAQLEHPSVVPVYELGVDPSGREFFTMKRVSGVTLRAVLQALADGDRGADEQFPAARLVLTFRALCEVVEYAHARSVIHRDINPANVMIGDFGEVYVLDWSSAKVVDEGESGLRHTLPTARGQQIGTLGYMAPEQLASAQIADHRSDIYSLGAILFELLTIQPLHVGPTKPDLVRSTQQGADARASERAPSRAIAPELDAIVVRATLANPKERFRSVRELREALDHFLEGGRNVALRRQLAARHETLARKALSESIHGTRDVEEKRTTALREAGRALALHPDSEVAQRILAALLVEPPQSNPPAVESALAEEQARELREVGSLGGAVYFLFSLTSLLVLWAGVRSWAGFAAIFLPLLAASATAFLLVKRPTTPIAMTMTAFASLAIACASGLFGPLVLVPTLAAANTLAVNVGLFRRLRWVYVALGCGALVVPAVLEWVGVLPRAYVFVDGNMVILPLVENHPEAQVRVGLLIANLCAIILPALVAWRQSDVLARLERTMHLTAWHLRRLVPGDEEPKASGEA